MDYRYYTDLDFASDDYFVRWVRFPDEHSNHFWTQWLKDHPHKEKEINRAKRLLLSINTKPAEWDAQRQIDLKQKVMENVQNEKRTNEVKTIKLQNKTRLLRIAAVLVCVIGAAIAHFYYTDDVVYYAAENETKEVLLPDGSIVKMNNNTRLSYKKNWWSSKRDAFLEGEAFFKVKHDDHSLFTVHYGELHAKVLGTSFNVRAYKGLEEARVTVLTGKVEVGQGDKSFGLITPNKEVVYNKEEKVNVTREVDAKKISEWNNVEVNLFDVPFSELIFTLEQVYHINIDYPTDMLKNTLTTIHFQKSDELTDVLKVIKTIHHLKYSFKGKKELLLTKDN